MPSSRVYTIELVKEIEPYGDVAQFFYDEGPDLANAYGFDFNQFDFFSYAARHKMWICRMDGKPVGVMLARIYPSVWDNSQMVLWQDSLFCKKSSGLAFALLLETFIDFGRAHANLVFTCKAKHTNLKERSFNRLGFYKSEELFRLGD